MELHCHTPTHLSRCVQGQAYFYCRLWMSVSACCKLGTAFHPRYTIRPQYLYMRTPWPSVHWGTDFSTDAGDSFYTERHHLRKIMSRDSDYLNIPDKAAVREPLVDGKMFNKSFIKCISLFSNISDILKLFIIYSHAILISWYSRKSLF